MHLYSDYLIEEYPENLDSDYVFVNESVQRQEKTLVEQYSPYLESIPLQHPEVRESLYLNLANLGTTAKHISDNLAQLRLGLAIALPQLAQYLPRSDFSPSGFESLKDLLETAINTIRPVLFNDYQVDIREKVKMDPSLDENLVLFEPTRLIIVLARIFDDIVAQSWLDERTIPSIEVTVETNPQNLTLKITTLGSFRLEPITLSNCQQALDYYEGKILASQEENLTQWSIILPDF
jgi:hypothetical protein